MSPAEIKALYRSMCQMTIVIRRTANGVTTDFTVKGHFRQVAAKEIIGTIAAGDLAVIVLADDLATAGFPLPIVTTDRAYLAGRERRVMSVGERKALDGTLIAYDLQARG